MSAQLFPDFYKQFVDANGVPLSGGKVYFYQAGTSTPQDTYTDESAATPNANPVVLDSNGTASIWMDPSKSYKVVLEDSLGVTIKTVDNVSFINSSVISGSMIIDGTIKGVKFDSGIVDNATIEITNNGGVDSLNVKASGIGTTELGAKVVTTAKVADNAITRAQMVAVGQQISLSSGTWSSTSVLATDVTNLSVTITTTGRPVIIALTPDGTNNRASVGANCAAGASDVVASLLVYLLRGATIVAITNYYMEVGSAVSAINYGPPPGVLLIDPVAAGTYTYKIQAAVEYTTGASGTGYVEYCQLVAYEL